MGLLDGIISFFQGGGQFEQVLNLTSRALEGVLQDPSLSAKQRDALRELIATCRAMASEHKNIASDRMYAQAFMEQAVKAIKAVRDLVPPAVLGPLESVVNSHLHQLGLSGIMSMQARLGRRRRLRHHHCTAGKRRRSHNTLKRRTHKRRRI
jgi:hypothetical protein